MATMEEPTVSPERSSAPAPVSRATLSLWALSCLIPMVALPVYLPLSALPMVDLGGLHGEPWPLTALFIASAVAGLVWGLRVRSSCPGELRLALTVGSVAAMLGVTMWTSYVHHLSDLDVDPRIPEVGEKAPDFSLPFPEDFSIQMPMMPFPLKPKGVQFSSFQKKNKAVLLVFFRAHW